MPHRHHHHHHLLRALGALCLVFLSAPGSAQRAVAKGTPATATPRRTTTARGTSTSVLESPSSSSSSSSCGTGCIVAIVIVVILFAGVFIGVCFWVRRRTGKKKAEDQVSIATNGGLQMADGVVYNPPPPPSNPQQTFAEAPLEAPQNFSPQSQQQNALTEAFAQDPFVLQQQQQQPAFFNQAPLNNFPQHPPYGGGGQSPQFVAPPPPPPVGFPMPDVEHYGQVRMPEYGHQEYVQPVAFPTPYIPTEQAMAPAYPTLPASPKTPIGGSEVNSHASYASNTSHSMLISSALGYLTLNRSPPQTSGFKRWSEFNFSGANIRDPQSGVPMLLVSMDGLTLEFPIDKPVSVMTDAGIPVPNFNDLGESKDYIYYYEIRPRRLEGILAIGFSVSEYSAYELPGRDVGSMAFYSDGSILQNGQPIKSTTDSFAIGKTVGCAYRPSDGLCMFLAGGRVQAVIEGFCVGAEMKPCIGAVGPCRVEVGFGLASLIDD